MLSANWDQKTLKAATDLARRNLKVRLNSLKNVGYVGPSGGHAPPGAAAPNPQWSPDSGGGGAVTPNNNPY